MVKKKKSLGAAFSDEVLKVTSQNAKVGKGLPDEWKDMLLPNFKVFEKDKFSPDSFLQTLFFMLTLVLFFIVFSPQHLYF